MQHRLQEWAQMPKQPTSMNRHVSEGRIGNCEATSVNFREGNLPAANESTRDNKQKFRPKQMHEELETRALQSSTKDWGDN